MNRMHRGFHISSKLAVSRKPAPAKSSLPPSKRSVTPVYISLTTIPARVDKLDGLMHRLLNEQTIMAAGVIVHLPKTYDASLGQIDDVPTTWKSYSETKLIVNRNCRDMGPATKLLGCISVPLPNDAIIIYIDDDHVYPKTLVESHLSAHVLYERTVFCGRGDILAENGSIRESFRGRKYMPVHLPCGVETVSLKLKDIDLKALVKEFRTLTRDKLFCDDLMFGDWFARHKISVRLLPLHRSQRLQQSYDEHALCRGLRVGGKTTQRYVRVIQSMQDNFHIKTHRTIQVGPMRLYVRQQVNMKTPTSTTAILVFAWNRPDYFKRTIESIRKNAGDRDVIIFLDGAVNLFSGDQHTEESLIAEVAKIAKKTIPNATIVRAAYNYGVGLMQFFGLYTTFALGYERVLVCEDDLVLGDHYVESVEKLCQLMNNVPHLAAVQGGYRKESEDANALLVADSFAIHMHYWGWMTTQDRFQRILKRYQAAAEELFWDKDYVTSKNREGTPPFIDWFKRHGLKARYRSQDWVRDGCFRLEGMCFKMCCAKRRAAPIGEIGLHSTKERFAELGLDSSTKDIHSGAPHLEKMTILTPRIVIESHTASCYPDSITGVACYDYILRSLFPDAVRYKPQRQIRGGDLSVVIADNHFVMDIPKNRSALIVHHGIAQLHGERDSPWAKRNKHLITAQHNMFLQRNPKNTAIVSCSKFCTDSFAQRNKAYERFQHHSIPHTSALPQTRIKRRVLKKGERPVIVGDWRFPHKGKEVIDKLIRALPEFEFRQMSIPPPKPFDVSEFIQRKIEFYQQADMAFVLSSHEGNSYFLLDAMQMDLVCVSTDVGLAPELPPEVMTTIDWHRCLVEKNIQYMVESIQNAWKTQSERGAVNAYCLEHFNKEKYAIRTLAAILSVAKTEGTDEETQYHSKNNSKTHTTPNKKPVVYAVQRIGRSRRVR